jgi:hypothetical protein
MMNVAQLARTDINLLVLFDVVFKERHRREDRLPQNYYPPTERPTDYKEFRKALGRSGE